MFDSFSTQVLSLRNGTQSSMRMFEKLKKVKNSSKKAFKASKKNLKHGPSIHKSSLNPPEVKTRSSLKVPVELACLKILNVQRRFIRSYWDTLQSSEGKIKGIIENCIQKTLNSYFLDLKEASSPRFSVEESSSVRTFSLQEQKSKLSSFAYQTVDSGVEKIVQITTSHIHRAFDLILLSRIETVKASRKTKRLSVHGLSIITEPDLSHFYDTNIAHFGDTFIGAHKRMNSTSDVSLIFKI